MSSTVTTALPCLCFGATQMCSIGCYGNGHLWSWRCNIIIRFRHTRFYCLQPWIIGVRPVRPDRKMVQLARLPLWLSIVTDHDRLLPDIYFWRLEYIGTFIISSNYGRRKSNICFHFGVITSKRTFGLRQTPYPSRMAGSSNSTMPLTEPMLLTMNIVNNHHGTRYICNNTTCTNKLLMEFSICVFYFAVLDCILSKLAIVKLLLTYI